jgi:hypothetical protein
MAQLGLKEEMRMDVGALSVDALAGRCAEETERFRRREPSDQQFCFELLRRALADGVHEAFARAYAIYDRQVLTWVYSHRGFAQTGEEAEFFARSALSSFYFALRGPRFARFPALPQVLAYLKLCVHTAIVQYLRDQRPADSEPLVGDADAAYSPELGQGVDAAELWAQIRRLLPDERDRLLARFVFLQDLKPRQVVAAAPGRWADEREVTLASYRIRRLLRADPALRRLAGLDDEPSHERGA